MRRWGPDGPGPGHAGALARLVEGLGGVGRLSPVSSATVAADSKVLSLIARGTRDAQQRLSSAALSTAGARMLPPIFHGWHGGRGRTATRMRIVSLSPRLIAVVSTAIAFVTWTGSSFAAPPRPIQHFKSSSGHTQIVYFVYDAGPCGAGVGCTFRGTVRVPAGFEQVELFLSGFKLEALKQSDAIARVTATVRKENYDPTSGALELYIASTLSTKTVQQYSYSVTFVVLMTSASLAKFTPIGGGCAGINRCRIVRSLPTAVPNGMQYIGLATYSWDIGSNSGPLQINTLGGHQDGLTVTPVGADVEYSCVMQDARRKSRMFCEWGAKVIAFDPTEMEKNGSTIFPQYTFLSMGTNLRQAWTENSASPSRSRLAGFFDAFEGLGLTYYRPFASTSLIQNPVWLLESSAANFRISPSAPDTAQTDYGIFLGTDFGDYSKAQRYGYQESRAFGLLR
jgi:hypothetical protein